MELKGAVISACERRRDVFDRGRHDIDRGQQHRSGGCAARVYHEAAEMPPYEAAVDGAGRSGQIGNLAGSVACEHRGQHSDLFHSYATHQAGC
jgi:hypothetical protein